MPFSVDIRKFFKSPISAEVVETPGDQFGRYLHQLGIYRDLIEENKLSVMNPDLGVLLLSEYERNQNNITDLTARIAESRQSYKEPELITQRKLLGVIPLGMRRWIV
jgi:hypothetical protein